jgi:transposase
LPENLRIVTLPPYSPELNPVEGLWDQLKDVLCNRGFASVAELETEIVRWLGSFWRDTLRIRSLVFGWLQDCVNASSRNIIPTI